MQLSLKTLFYSQLFQDNDQHDMTHSATRTHLAEQTGKHDYDVHLLHDNPVIFLLQHDEMILISPDK